MVTWAEHKAEQKAWRNRPVKYGAPIPEVKQYGNTRPPWVRLRVPQQIPRRNRERRLTERLNAAETNAWHEYRPGDELC